MKLKLSWHKHPNYATAIIGNADELPDTFCGFTIFKVSANEYQVYLPLIDNINTRLMCRDPSTARVICEDFLNYNLRALINHQIKEMNRSNRKWIKPISHYETLLDKLSPVVKDHTFESVRKAYR